MERVRRKPSRPGQAAPALRKLSAKRGAARPGQSRSRRRWRRLSRCAGLRNDGHGIDVFQ